MQSNRHDPRIESLMLVASSLNSRSRTCKMLVPVLDKEEGKHYQESRKLIAKSRHHLNVYAEGARREVYRQIKGRKKLHSQKYGEKKSAQRICFKAIEIYGKTCIMFKRCRSTFNEIQFLQKHYCQQIFIYFKNIKKFKLCVTFCQINHTVTMLK